MLYPGVDTGERVPAYSFEKLEGAATNHVELMNVFARLEKGLPVYFVLLVH
jgi:hypothetical protein